MLILSRRVGETLVIGGNVIVTILRARGKQIRVGITAPAAIEVHRGEIFERIQRSKHPAAELGLQK